MDPLPQIPKSGACHDTVGPIRDVFARELEQEGFPIELANNIRTYSVDDNLSLKETAKNTLEIQRCLEEESEIVSGAEFAILQQHGDYIVQRDATAKNQFLREIMRLKFCDIFPNVCLPDKLKYGLLEKCDLYPDVTRQFLDFRFNAGRHQCHRCFPEVKPAGVGNDAKRIGWAWQHRFSDYNPSSMVSMRATKRPPPQPALLLMPPRVEFRNFELNRRYQQSFRIKNVSGRVQKVSVSARPQLAKVFQLDFEPCRQLAPGMSLKGLVQFTPAYFANLEDSASFVSGRGEALSLVIQSRRDPPKLLGFVSKAGASAGPGTVRVPGSRHFSGRRQNAVNSTIDCGSCFCAEHVLVSLVLANHGNTARFFWLTEEEFCCQDVTTVSETLELKSGSFWIYPSFFEMPAGDICEVNMLFQPLEGGFHAQTLFLMCDNNTYQQIELIGDAVRFNKNIVSVGIPHHATELQTKPGHRVFLGHVGCHEARQFTLSISNRCSLALKYGLSFQPWMSSNSAPPFLAPYSVTDIVLDCACPADVPEGYYGTAVTLFIREVPIVSLEGEEQFLIRGVSPVDVLVMEVEVACFVDLQTEQSLEGPGATCQRCECACASCRLPPLPMADLEFDRAFLDFGVRPVGADGSKALSIRNRGAHELRWLIAELRYHVDGRPHVELLREPLLRPKQGRLQPGQEQRLVYGVVAQPVGRRASILVLFQTGAPLVAQSVCVVTSEVVELSMRIRTGQSPEPILCPMRMLYSGVPVELSFKLHNDSAIPGPFYFMEPLGSDADKVRVLYSPQSGELKPGATKTIRLALTCFEVGILENVLLPCFIGKAQTPLQLRLLCAVDCVHVFFYLPGSKGDFQKVLWPPKVVYEYDTEWSSYCLCGEEEEEDQSRPTVISRIQSEEQLETTGNEDSDSHGLLRALASADSEIFLQDCVMQVHGLRTKEPRKVTIYLENVTPKSAKYCVQPTNYSCDKGRFTPPKLHRLWEPLIHRHGFLVEPEVQTGFMGPNELVAVHIWIYAATWGIYAEEVVVDIEDIAPFSFSLIVEVVGSPLELPLAAGAITRYPTIRLGAVAMDSADVTRDLVLRNISSIEVTVAWHVFLRQEDVEGVPFNLVCDAALDQFALTFTDRFLGVQASEALEVEPSKGAVGPGAQLQALIVLKPRALSPTEDQRAVSWFLLGRMFAKEEDRLRPGYLLRRPATLIVEVTATLVRAQLQVELMETPLRLYANEVALRRRSDFSIRCLLRNPTLSQLELELECSEPLSLGVKLVVGPHKCKEIELPCLLSQEKILKWAASVYRLTETKSAPRDSIGAAEMRLQPGDEKAVDDEHKVLTLHRKLVIYFQGGAKKIVPIDIMIYYPHIAVKPVHVKFGYVLLGRTQKTSVTIFNLTGYEVLFEIYKTVATQEIFVTPSNGTIEKSVGLNHSFANVSVFFTPTECRTYHESIRIVTNIPHYYIDVPIKGAGSFNEKFE